MDYVIKRTCVTPRYKVHILRVSLRERLETYSCHLLLRLTWSSAFARAASKFLLFQVSARAGSLFAFPSIFCRVSGLGSQRQPWAARNFETHRLLSPRARGLPRLRSRNVTFSILWGLKTQRDAHVNAEGLNLRLPFAPIMAKEYRSRVPVRVGRF